MFKILKIIFGVVLVIICAPILLGLILKGLSDDVPPPGEMADVGGYKLHINCVGSNVATGRDLPTVVFESGSGTTSPYYHWIQEGLAETTKVCLYDRAGLAWSDESDLPRDAETITTALHTLLNKADIKRPFVFAGHSIAGLYMRHYVNRFPEEVSGIAFLDPSHPRQPEVLKMSPTENAEKLKEAFALPKILFSLGIIDVLQLLQDPPVQDAQSDSIEITEQKTYVGKMSKALDATYYESRDFDKAGLQAVKNTTLGDRPVVVISAAKPMPSAGPVPMDQMDPMERQKKFQGLHKEIVALSSDGTHVVFEDADHMSLVVEKKHAEKTVPYIRDIVLKSAK